MSQPVDVVSVGIEYDTSRSLAQLRAAVDSALGQVTREFDQAFSEIERGAAGAGADVGRQLAQGGEKAEGALREVERQAKRSLNEVSQQAHQAGTALGGLGGIIGKIGFAAAGAAAVAGLGAIASSGLQAAAGLEQTQVAFNSLLGSAEQGKKVFDGLKEFAAATPFELTDLTGTAQRFLAFNDTVNISDDQLQTFLTTLGNVASVTSAGAFGMERVTLALGQIASTGKLTLDNLNQISEALPGFSGIAAIAAYRGTTTAQAMKDISSGAISAEDGVKGLLAGMEKFPGAAGAMEAQSLTLLGVFSTFKDTVSQALAGAFEPVIPALKDSLSELTPILGEAVGLIAPAIGETLVTIVQNLTPLLTPLAKVVGIVLKALAPFINILGVILGPIIEALVPVFEALAPVVEDLSVPLLQLIDALLPLVPVIAQILVAVIAVIAPFLQLLGVIVGFLSQKAIVPLVTLLAQGLGFLAEAVRQFGVWLTQVDWGAVLTTIGHFFTDLWHTISDFFIGIAKWFAELPRKAAEAFVALNTAILTKILELVAFVNSLPGRVVKALGNMATLLVDKGKDLIRGLWEGISSLGGWLWSKITGFVQSQITGPIKAALGISSPSKVMADQVGKQITAGISVGVEAGVPGLRSLIDGLVTPGPGMATASGGSGITIGPGAIIMQFHGASPSVAQAAALGEAAGAGVARALARRDINSAVRMR